MPNIESAKKRMRQNEVRRMRNRSRKQRMRTAIKKFEKLVEENVDEARLQLPGVYGIIDRTSRKGIIHSNAAARYKSRLARMIESRVAAG